MADRYECPVCGAQSRKKQDLCAADPSDGACDGVRPDSPVRARSRPEGSRVALEMRAVEILFCPSVRERATYSCDACGRLATEGDLVCLPKERA